MSVGSTQTRAAVVLLAPFLTIFAVFMAFPLVQAVWLAFQQTHGPGYTRFVGFDNFAFLVSDRLFWKAAANTAVFAIASLLTQIPIALGLAMLLNRPDIRGRALFRLIFFSPSLVGLVFVAVLFGLIFEKRTGLLNVVLHAAFGFDLEFQWLQEYIMPALVIAALWLYVGFNMVFFLAALQNVSRDLLEAATIDGASSWGRFRHVTMPAIRPVASFLVLLSLIGSFQLFELPYILLRGPGPDNQGLTVVMYLYQTGFDAGDLGYASAIGWMIAMLLAVFAVGHRFLAKYEEG